MSIALSGWSGVATSGLSSISQGITSWKKGEEENKIAKRKAGYLAIESAEEERRMKMELEELQGKQAAKYGASGVRSEGSPMDVMLSTQREGQKEIDFKKLMNAIKIRETLKAGALAKKAGTSGAIGSVLSGIANVGGQVYSLLGSDKDVTGYKMKNPMTGSYWNFTG